MAADIKVGADVSAAAGSVGREAWAEAGSVCHSRISVPLAPYERREPQRSGELPAATTMLVVLQKEFAREGSCRGSFLHHAHIQNVGRLLIP
jgi:hypothetical protein